MKSQKSNISVWGERSVNVLKLSASVPKAQCDGGLFRHQLPFYTKGCLQKNKTDKLGKSSKPLCPPPQYGGPENTKVRYELADTLIPFLWGILRSSQNFKFLGGQEVLALESQYIQKKF